MLIKKIVLVSLVIAQIFSKSLLKSRSSRPYGQLTAVEESSHCRSITAHVYEFCRKMLDCNMCLETDHCGWCGSKCVPAAKQIKACVNSPDYCPEALWSTSPSQCQTPKFHIGSFKNIAQDASFLISPTIATPNIDIKINDNVKGFSHFSVPMNPASQEFGLHGIN